ncbi:DUF2726 domain-containing protein [Nitrincola alkalilacustris]|uniref:DUF2726 domain-containing protein n=1 Tax=Nitrincola alkalilacustris TaxID=1571224 RepID=UPI00124DCB10|nr:DUF2726 domain-containing protein [Nitrincola alkalilacustris]
MEGLLIAAVVIIVIALVFAKSLKGRVSGPEDYPYQKAGPLFTPAERSFYGVLSQAVGTNATIFGKVRVADIATPRKGLARSIWQRAFNKISAKHFDFVLCDSDDLSVICVLELDDSSHKASKRQQRDEFLTGVCSAADIPFIRVPAKAGYVISEIQALLAPHLTAVSNSATETAAEPEAELPVEAPEKQIEKIEKSCAKCSSSMVVRVARSGANAGKQFWACSTYPKCRHIEAINEVLSTTASLAATASSND